MIRIVSINNKFSFIIVFFLLTATINYETVSGQLKDLRGIAILTARNFGLHEDILAEFDVIEIVHVVG